MNKNEALKYICGMPQEFNTTRDVSWNILCYEAKKYISDFKISKQEVMEFLKRNKTFIDYWIQYSDDKRTSGGYGLDPDSGILKIKQYVKNDKLIVLKASEDFAEICAEYIFMECHLTEVKND